MEEKSKGYWQAIANYDYALSKFTASFGFEDADIQQVNEIFELRENHPVHGDFFDQLANIMIVISDTYGVPIEVVSTDIDILFEAYELLLDIKDEADWLNGLN